MAFDFLGTFSRSDFAGLFQYAEAHLVNVEPRIEYLKSEIERLGWLEYEFDEEGIRVAYTVRPVNSLLAKYSRAFEYYGGDLTDLQIRSRGDWIFVTKGEFDLSDARPYAGGKPSEGDYKKSNRHYNDDVPGNYVHSVKEWVLPSIKRRLEDLEFRIKRVVDLSDQHVNEIILLIKRSVGAETLEQLRTDIEYFISSQDFTSVSEE